MNFTFVQGGFRGGFELGDDVVDEAVLAHSGRLHDVLVHVDGLHAFVGLRGAHALAVVVGRSPLVDVARVEQNIQVCHVHGPVEAAASPLEALFVDGGGSNIRARLIPIRGLRRGAALGGDGNGLGFTREIVGACERGVCSDIVVRFLLIFVRFSPSNHAPFNFELEL